MVQETFFHASSVQKRFEHSGRSDSRRLRYRSPIGTHQGHFDQLRYAPKFTERRQSKREQVVRCQQQVKQHETNKSDSNATAARIRVDQDAGISSARTRGMFTSFDTLPSAQRDAHQSVNRSCADNRKSNNINGTKAIQTQLPLGFG